jgi:excisionase family DNA binding protein
MPDDPAASSAIVSAADVAELFGVSDKTVRRWQRKGLIRALRLPSGQHRYRLSDIEAVFAAAQAEEEAG